FVAGRRQQGHLGAGRRWLRPIANAERPIAVARPNAMNLPLLSRVAESVYWMSRYMERADNVARFVNVNLQLILDAPAVYRQQWEALITASGDSETFAERYEEASHENVIRFLLFDRENPNSVVSCVRAARENARSIRDTITSDMWEPVNGLYLYLADTAV